MLKKAKIPHRFEITLNKKDDLLQIIEQKLKNKEAFRVVTFNPEMLVHSLDNPSFSEAVQSADAVIPDGIGLVYLLKKLGHSAKRMPGIELSWDVLQKTIELGLPIAIIGSTDKVLAEAVNNIQQKLGSASKKANFVFLRNGFFDEKEEEQIMDELLRLQPSLLLIAMPFPRQEAILHKLFKQRVKCVGMGVGGSLDVWSGNIDRAPKLFQAIGLEWLWRILKQPQRISRMAKVFIPFGKLYFSLDEGLEKK